MPKPSLWEPVIAAAVLGAASRLVLQEPAAMIMGAVIGFGLGLMRYLDAEREARRQLEARIAAIEKRAD